MADYTPAIPPQVNEDLLPFLNEEFVRVAQAYNNLNSGYWDINYKIPSKVKPGLIKYFDGTNADPLGSGLEGLYFYGLDGLWHSCGGSGGGAVDSVNGMTGTVVLDYSDVGAEPSIAAGTTSQYWRGDKSWQDLATAVRAVVLTGIDFSVNAAITATDTVLSAFGKLQKQFTDHFGSGGSNHAAVTTSVNGFMAATDKVKLDALSTPMGAIASRSTDLTLPNNTLVDLVFDTEEYDQGNFINTGTSTTYITIPKDGMYSIFAASDISPIGTASGVCNIRVVTSTGTIVLLVASPTAASSATQMSGSSLAYLTAGTLLKMSVFQNSGSSRTSRAFPYSNRFGATLVAYT